MDKMGQDLLGACQEIADGGKCRQLRNLAVAAFKARGLPSRRDESWKHTSLKTLGQHYRWEKKPRSLGADAWPALKSQWLGALGAGANFLHSSEAQRIVFFNGQWQPELTVLGTSCQWQSLAGDGLEQGEFSYLADKLAGQDVFFALALAYLQQSYKLVLSGLAPGPLAIYHLFDETFQGAMAHPLLLVEVAEKAQWDIAEFTLAGGELSPACYNSQTLFSLGPESDVEHVRVFSTCPGLWSLSQVHSEVARGASYRNTLLALGEGFLRNNVQVKLLQPLADTALNGLYVHHQREDSSHYSVISHCAPETSSRQLYQGIVDHHSHASFNGTIVVNPECPQITSEQLNKNIILSQTASVDSRPQLEIQSSDVKCNHGSTTGQWSEDTLFYLQSRGLSLFLARQLLVHGFCRKVVLKLERSALRASIQGCLTQLLEEKKLFVEEKS